SPPPPVLQRRPRATDTPESILLLRRRTSLAGSRALAAAAHRGDDIAIGRAARKRSVDVGRRGANRRGGSRGIDAIAGPAVDLVLRNTRSCGLSPAEADTPRLGGVCLQRRR